MVSNNYTKEECVSALNKAKEKLGHEPSQHEYRQLDISPSYQTITNKFGRWNIAKRKANMSENMPSHLKYQDGPPDILSYTDKEWNDLSKNLRFRRRNQARVAKIKMNKGCKNCGYDKNPAALEFHHRNPEEKVKGVAIMISQGLSISSINSEIEKCDVLCSRCHKIEENGDIYNI